MRPWPHWQTHVLIPKHRGALRHERASDRLRRWPCDCGAPDERAACANAVRLRPGPPPVLQVRAQGSLGTAQRHACARAAYACFFMCFGSRSCLRLYIGVAGRARVCPPAHADLCSADCGDKSFRICDTAASSPSGTGYTFALRSRVWAMRVSGACLPILSWLLCRCLPAGANECPGGAATREREHLPRRPARLSSVFPAPVTTQA